MDNTSFKIFKEESEGSKKRFARFIFEPLKRGYADTLGNALRRLLLSSIGSAAVTAVHINGILHEFDTIRGVREDVIEILINLKHIPVKVLNEFPRNGVKVVTLDTDKLPEDFFTRDENPGVITAKDMPKDPDFEFVGDGILCTIEEDAEFILDLYVEEGEGYLPSERDRNASFPVEAILTDAIFSPVERVNYFTEPARVGQNLDYERLILEVWTNGAVEPYEAVKQASNIAKSYFSEIADMVENAEPINPVLPADGESQEPIDTSKIFLTKTIRELELSIRSENCLLRGGIKVVGDLLKYSRDELLKIRNLGRKSLDEIIAKIESYGYHLPDSTSTRVSEIEKSEEDLDSVLNEEDEDSFEDSATEEVEISSEDTSNLEDESKVVKEVEEPVAVEPPAKRKRGRPAKKTESNEQIQQVQQSEKTEKTKQTKQTEKTEETKQPEQVEQVEKTQQNEQIEQVEQKIETPKRKRGRPRKNPSPDTETEN